MSSYWDQDIYIKAWDFATIAHGHQTLKVSKEGLVMPYINHIGRVAMEVMSALEETPNLDGDLALQCAILHDTIEDTDVGFQQLEQEFGNSVAVGVLALSKDETKGTKMEQMQDSIARIKLCSKEVWMVKLADRITNLGSPPHHWSKEKIRAYREEAIFIHQELREASQYLANRLEKRIDQYLNYL